MRRAVSILLIAIYAAFPAMGRSHVHASAPNRHEHDARPHFHFGSAAEHDHAHEFPAQHRDDGLPDDDGHHRPAHHHHHGRPEHHDGRPERDDGPSEHHGPAVDHEHPSDPFLRGVGLHTSPPTHDADAVYLPSVVGSDGKSEGPRSTGVDSPPVLAANFAAPPDPATAVEVGPYRPPPPASAFGLKLHLVLRNLRI